MSDLLNPSSSCSSFVPGAVVEAGCCPTAPVALDTDIPTVGAGLALDATASGEVTILVSAALLDISTLAVAQYAP